MNILSHSEIVKARKQAASFSKFGKSLVDAGETIVAAEALSAQVISMDLEATKLIVRIESLGVAKAVAEREKVKAEEGLSVAAEALDKVVEETRAESGRAMEALEALKAELAVTEVALRETHAERVAALEEKAITLQGNVDVLRVEYTAIEEAISRFKGD